jgi:hypothetical protein
MCGSNLRKGAEAVIKPAAKETQSLPRRFERYGGRDQKEIGAMFAPTCRACRFAVPTLRSVMILKLLIKMILQKILEQ